MILMLYTRNKKHTTACHTLALKLKKKKRKTKRK